MLSGADTEWLPALGESWHVPHVPGIDATFKSSLRPATPVIWMGLELNKVCPRRIWARALPESANGCFAQPSKRLKITGVNGIPFGFPPRGSLMPIKNSGTVFVAIMAGP